MNPQIRMMLKWGALAAVVAGLLFVGLNYGQWQRDRLETAVIARGMRYAVEQISPAYLDYLRKNHKAPEDNVDLGLPPARDSLWIGFSRVQLYPNGDIFMEYDAGDMRRQPLLVWHIDARQDVIAGPHVCGARDIPERVLAWNGLRCDADVTVPIKGAPIPALASMPAREVSAADKVLEAVRANNATTLASLRTSGADICAPNGDGVLPLNEAVRGNQGPVIQALIAVPCNINAVETFTGRTALMVAVAAHDPELSHILIGAGADVQLRNAEGDNVWFILGTGADPLSQQVRMMLMQKGIEINTVAADNGTLLMRAAYAGSAQMVDWLLQNGAKIDLQDKSGRTALMHAVLAQRQNDAVIQQLLARYPQLNLRDADGKTALGLAATIPDLARQSQVVRTLQSAGAKM